MSNAAEFNKEFVSDGVIKFGHIGVYFWKNLSLNLFISYS